MFHHDHCQYHYCAYQMILLPSQAADNVLHSLQKHKRSFRNIATMIKNRRKHVEINIPKPCQCESCMLFLGVGESLAVLDAPGESRNGILAPLVEAGDMDPPL